MTHRGQPNGAGDGNAVELSFLPLVLRVLVTSALMPEQEGSKPVLKHMGKGVSRLHTIWIDGGCGRGLFMLWGVDICQWIVQVVL